MDKAPAIFEEQLKKCGVEYFDFYLFHNVCEMNIDAYLDTKYGIFAYLIAQREAGRIRRLGFSAHGSLSVMKRFLEAYGERMEFCQIQLNYLDWTFQDAKAKVDLLAKYHIPVWVMEPLRGGRLAALSEEDTAKLTEMRPEEKTPAWAFRFLQTIPGVMVILSGMSSLGQMRDNITTFETEKPLNEAELNTLLTIADGMAKKAALPCTGCRYCVSHCPQELDIPRLIELYNEHCFTANAGLPAFIAPMALAATPENKRPAACIGCKSCEAVCPQQIKIADAFADFTAKLK
jgi:predicted aldo/keto reductase-like oxidoreductase